MTHNKHKNHSVLIAHSCMLRKLKSSQYKATIFDKIRWRTRDLYDFFRYDVLRGLQSLVAYSPLIFWTREWDQFYLYELMAFKLKRMEPVIRDGFHIHANQTANVIKKTREALERLAADDYIIKYTGKEIEAHYLRDMEIVLNGIKRSREFWD